MAYLWSIGSHIIRTYWRCDKCGETWPHGGYSDSSHIMHVTRTGHTVFLFHVQEEQFVAAGFPERQ